MSLLAALRVLDLSEGVSGPYCTKLLADHGAEVIKIERPGGGDPIRRHGPFPADLPHPEKGALFLYLNTNKKSITLDLCQRTGILLFRRLVLEAEVVVENHRPGYLDGLGLAYRELSRLKPRLIMTSITPFGQSGPYACYQASGLTSLAMGGQMSAVSGGKGWTLENDYLAEYQAGLHAFAATAVAAFSVDASEVGQHIDISVMDCLASALAVGAAEPFIALSHSLRDLPEPPQLGERRYSREIDHPEAGRLTYPGPPFRASGLAWQPGRAPLLGEHNEEIYCGLLGLSRQELVILRASGVI